MSIFKYGGFKPIQKTTTTVANYDLMLLSSNRFELSPEFAKKLDPSIILGKADETNNYYVEFITNYSHILEISESNNAKFNAELEELAKTKNIEKNEARTMIIHSESGFFLRIVKVPQNSTEKRERRGKLNLKDGQFSDTELAKLLRKALKAESASGKDPDTKIIFTNSLEEQDEANEYKWGFKIFDGKVIKIKPRSKKDKAKE